MSTRRRSHRNRATTYDHKEVAMKTTILALLSALLSVVPYANAQGVDNRIPTNLPGVFTYSAPPAGFDPVAASSDELAAYGLPPRPDKNSVPHAYAAWADAMSASKQRITPILKTTNRYHGPNVAKGQVENGAANSYNWSGYVMPTSSTGWGSSNAFTTIISAWVVPVA